MDKVIKLEELAQFIAIIAILHYSPVHISWWLWPVIFLLPDLSMIGYVAGPAVGGVSYDLVHHKLVALAVIGLGWYIDMPYVLLAGLVLYGHSSMDRMLGYGLKYLDGFKHTHLGIIG